MAKGRAGAKKQINRANDSIVAVQGEKVLILSPKRVYTKGEALRLAARLVALADTKDEFPPLLEAVRNT